MLDFLKPLLPSVKLESTGVFSVISVSVNGADANHQRGNTAPATQARGQGQGQGQVKKGKESKEAGSVEDDDDDLFGDDGDDEAANALKEKLEAQRKASQEGKKSEKKSARSLIVLDVKPYDAETDLKELVKSIKSIKHEGIQNWGDEHKFEDIAFGIQKLIVSVVVYDDLLGVDDLNDLMMERNEDDIQSIDVAAMSKV